MITDEVLELIVEGGLVNKKGIAGQIGIQVETLNHIIDLLCQRGYLKTSGQSCSEGMTCSGCPLSESCGSTDKYGRVLVVTEKGKKYIERRRTKKNE